MVEPKFDEEKKEEPTVKPVVAKPQKATPPKPPLVDPYKLFIDSNQIVTPEDLAAYRNNEDGIVAVFVDVRGRSSLNCSLYLRNSVLDKLEKARKEPVKKE